MSKKPIRPLCQRLPENMREHQFTPEMHNTGTSMEGLTSLNFYRYVSHLVAGACPILRSSTGSDRIRQSVHPPVLGIGA